MKQFLLALLLLGCSYGFSQSVVGNGQDGGPSLPATCNVGQQPYFLTTGTIGLYACLTANTWTQLSTGSAGGNASYSGTNGDVACGTGTAHTLAECSPAITQAKLGAINTLHYIVTFPAIATAQTWATKSPVAVTFPANFTTPTATISCGTNPGGTVVFTLRDVTTAADVGTVSVSSSCVGTFATTGGIAVVVNAGDFLTVVSGTDATAANVVIDFRATRN